jgi:hypothetical protein
MVGFMVITGESEGVADGSAGDESVTCGVSVADGDGGSGEGVMGIDNGVGV